MRFNVFFFYPFPDPVLGKVAGFRIWFEKRLDNAIQAAQVQKEQLKSENGNSGQQDGDSDGGSGGGSGGKGGKKKEIKTKIFGK